MTKSEKIWLWVLIALAVVFRLFLLRYRFAVSFDGPHYLQMAASFAQGNWQGLLHPYWPPGYPFIVGMVSFLFHDYEFAGRFTNIVIGSLTIFPIYMLAKSIWNRRYAYTAGIFIAFYPPLAYFHTTARADPMYIFFGFLGVWLGWQAFKDFKWHKMALAGLSWGMAYLAKPEGVGFLLIYLMLVLIILIYWIKKKISIHRLWSVVFVPMGFLIIAAGYLVYLHNEAGFWTLSAKGTANQQFEATYFTPENDDVFDKLNPENTSLAMDEIYHTGTFLQDVRKEGPKIKVSPKLLLRKYSTNLYRVLKYGIPTMLTLPIGILFALGLFAEAWPKKSILPALYVLSFVAFYWFVLVPMFHINERYIISMLPAVSIWIAAGYWALAKWIEGLGLPVQLFKMPSRSMANIVAAVFVLLISFMPEFGKVMQHTIKGARQFDEPLELKMAGQWLKNYTGTKKPPIIMSYNKAVDFYAGNYDVKSGVSFSRDSTNRILAYARNRGVEYFVLDERYLRKFPILKLWVEDGPPAELKKIYEKASPSGMRAWIFTWNKNNDRDQLKTEVLPGRNARN